MSDISYYRGKFTPTSAGTTSKVFYVNGSVAKTCTIITKPFCTGEVLCKYLNHNGQYRFIKFNKYYIDSINRVPIGSVQNIITSLYSGQSDKLNIGYKCNRTLTLINDDITLAEMEIFADIFTSPRVYLHVGIQNVDYANSWVLVQLKETTNGINFGKRKFGEIQITIELPEYHSIKMT